MNFLITFEILNNHLTGGSLWAIRNWKKLQFKKLSSPCDRNRLWWHGALRVKHVLHMAVELETVRSRRDLEIIMNLRRFATTEVQVVSFSVTLWSNGLLFEFTVLLHACRWGSIIMRWSTGFISKKCCARDKLKIEWSSFQQFRQLDFPRHQYIHQWFLS